MENRSEMEGEVWKEMASIFLPGLVNWMGVPHEGGVIRRLQVGMGMKRGMQVPDDSLPLSCQGL